MPTAENLSTLVLKVDMVVIGAGIPGLVAVRLIFDFFSNLGNIFIGRQDRRVVVTQSPFRSELRMGEKLIPGDAPVIEYRRRRQMMIDGE